jgi:hypothetical protein
MGVSYIVKKLAKQGVQKNIQLNPLAGYNAQIRGGNSGRARGMAI